MFVVGFYDPVKVALESIYADRIADESINWVRQKSQGREANLTEFSAVYSKRVRAGMQSALVLLAILRGRGWVVGSVRNIIEAASVGGKPSYQLVEMENVGER